MSPCRPSVEPWPVWPGGGGRAPFQADAVLVFRVALEVDAPTRERLFALLDGPERARVERRRAARTRDEFLITRAALRRVLGTYLDRPPESLAFVNGEHGKPALQCSGPEPIEFNVSHSHEWALIALGKGGPLGVDIERMRPKVDYPRIASRFFSEREQAALSVLPPAEQQAAFFRCWARKEAVIKAHGRGVGLGLDRFDVTVAPGTPPRLEAIRWEGATDEPWQIFEIDVVEGYMAALAVRSRERPSIVRYAWAP